MNAVVNLEETPGKVVGRNFAAVADYDRLVTASQSLMPRLPFPKGVYRFRTFEEADTWTEQHILQAAVGEWVHRFKARTLDEEERRQFAEQALLLRYPSLVAAPVNANTLLQVRRPEDEGTSLWSVSNCVQEHLLRGGVSDQRRDQRGKLRSVRALRGIDSKVGLNKALWGLAERFANGEIMPVTERSPIACSQILA